MRSIFYGPETEGQELSVTRAEGYTYPVRVLLLIATMILANVRLLTWARSMHVSNAKCKMMF